MTKRAGYEPRLYRGEMGNRRWKNFRVGYRETDLWIAVDNESYAKEMERYTMECILRYRKTIEDHISLFPLFRDSLAPVIAPGDTDPVIAEMYDASHAAETGPMSCVAGTMAEHIACDLVKKYGLREVIVENGGDIFMQVTSQTIIAVHAGTSPLSGKIGLTVNPGDTPLAVCCSSGTIGHSLSFGKADACMIACRSGALADAYATSFCNKIHSEENLSPVTEKALSIPEILSVVIIINDKVSIGGTIGITMIQH